MIVFPAIDLSEGQVVRLHRGEMNQKTVYHDDPYDQAQQWVDQGGRFLHVVDLDGSFQGTPRNLASVAAICQVGIPVQVGGGVRDRDTIEAYLDCGVTRVIIGTAAVRDRAFCEAALERFGDRLVIDIGARDGKVAVQGWSETTSLDVIEFAQTVAAAGACRLVFTDVQTDGALEGPNLAAQERMARAVDIPIIASGGVTTADDVARLALLEVFGVEGVIIGRALYEGTCKLADALKAANTPGMPT